MSAKSGLRIRAAQALFRTRITSPGWRARGVLSIVTFHRVLPIAERRAYPFPGLAVTPSELDAFLKYFTKYFDCGPLAAQHERFTKGEPTSRPLLALTFDDACHDNFAYAAPVLARHGVKASFFAPVDAVKYQTLLWPDRLGFALKAFDRTEAAKTHLREALLRAGLNEAATSLHPERLVETAKRLKLRNRLRLIDDLEQRTEPSMVPAFARPMTFQELAQLAEDGHEIGSHSMTHCMMPECDDQELAYELEESRRTLQTEIGQTISSFCYPNGNSDNRTAAAVASAGYSRAVTTENGFNRRDANPLRLRRWHMDTRRVLDPAGAFSADLLAFRMSGFYPGINTPT